MRCFTCGSLPGPGPAQPCSEFDLQTDQTDCQAGQLCVSYSLHHSQEPIRGCHHPNTSLHGLTVSPLPSCTSVQLTAGSSQTTRKFCSCNTELCNLNLYEYSDYSRVKRQGKVRQNFVFPFQPQSESETGAQQLESLGVRCYSCGSLFSRDVPDCPHFDRDNSSQREVCQPGEVCLLYSWKKSQLEMGSYRECFPSNIILGHPDDPIIPQPKCRLAKTQRDPRSSIRACLCTTDNCNTEEEAELEEERNPREFSKTSVSCSRVVVSQADYADCDGEYELSPYVVLWAVTRPVWRHVSKDRFIFWNKGGLGWSIGKKAYLTSGSHWHWSGLDSPEPWQGEWEAGVVVECVSPHCRWSDYSPWSPCSTSCGQGVQVRSRRLEEGGEQCEGEPEEWRRCFLSPCLTPPSDRSLLCLWSSWGAWGACSATCGPASQQRFRVFLVGQGGREGRALDQAKCQGGGAEGGAESRACSLQDCQPPVQCCDRLQVNISSDSATFSLQEETHEGKAVYLSTSPSLPHRLVYFVPGSGWLTGRALGNTQQPGEKVVSLHHLVISLNTRDTALTVLEML